MLLNHPGMCKEFNILVASNASAGTQVVLASGNDSPPVSTAIAGHYLPPECRVNHLCSILDFGHPSGTSHYIIPSIGGFVLLSHWADYDNRLPWHLFHDVTEDCNPTSAFLARSNQILVVACMNLRSRPHGTLYYMHYDVLPDSTGSGGIIRRNTVLPTKSEIIYNPATISEIIHVRGQAKCQQEDNLYCVDNGDVLYFPTSGTSDPGFSVSNAPLENCIGYQSLEHYPGDDNLIIRCSNYRTALYGSCSTGRFTYAPDDNIPYPCTNWSTVAYLNGTQLTLDGETQQLPSGDISFAKCVQGVNGPIFIASSNGSIFITRFDGNNVIEITSGNCSSNSDGTCPRPVFSKNNDIFVTFDSGSGDLMIVNVTEGCMGDPVIARIPIPIQPDLMSVSLARGVYNCSCSAAQSAEPPTTEDISQTEPATVKNQTEQTERHDSTTATHQSEATFPITTSSQTSSHPASISIEGLLAGVLITVAVLLSVIVTIM